jgi:GMP synthase (glutamine-hydrolysing)
MTDTHDKILIVDFGSQVTQLIARRVREEGVYSEIVPFNKAEEAFRTIKPRRILPAARHGRRREPRGPGFDGGLPVFGICYGQQTRAAQLGGRWRSAPFGIRAGRDRDLTEAPCSRGCGSGKKYPVWMSHGATGSPGLPEGFEVMAASENAPSRWGPTRSTSSTACSSTRRWCNPQGALLIRNFVRDIAGCAGD